MSNTAHVVHLNEVPYFELAATELVFRIDTANPQRPIYFHMAPYTAGQIKAALKGLKAKIKDAGATVLSEDADPAPLYALFDQLFRRMSNVVLNADGAEATLAQQQAWLDRNPRLKARVINEGFCLVFVKKAGMPQPGIEVNGRAIDQPVVLEDLLKLDEGAKVDFLCVAEDRAANAPVAIAVSHQFEIESSRDFSVYDRASQRQIEKSSGFTTMDVDYDALERLYDRTIRSVSGYAIDGEACTEANKKIWLPRLPFYHKKLALDARFEDITKKNG